jgi:hypothetical protein
LRKYFALRGNLGYGLVQEEKEVEEKEEIADQPTVTGTLKGYDALMNLVLDDVEEVMRGMFPSPSSCYHLLPNPIPHSIN